MSEKRTGTVKFWHEEKGYGFVIDSETKSEHYTYKNKLDADVPRLHNDSKVEFELQEKSGRGRDQVHAVNVKIIN